MIDLCVNLYSRCKVTPYFVLLQTFSLLFLQLVATNALQGDKLSQLPQNLSYEDDYFYFFPQKLPDFPKYFVSLHPKLRK